MSLWLIFLLGGLATFAVRFSFIYAFGRVSLPPAVHRALRFVPPAVLSAIIFPEILMTAGRVDLAPGSPRLLAGAAAVIIAVLTRKTLPTIVAGMTILLLLQRL